MKTFRRALFPVGLLLLVAAYILLSGHGQASSYQNLPVAPAVTSSNGLPSTVNWVTAGKVSPVKNQGPCGSGWAFSAAGAVESEHAIFGTGLDSVSEQQLVDCSSAQGNQGCNGGSPPDAFNYIIANGITSTAAYPYTATQAPCKVNGGSVKITSWTPVAGTVSALQAAVAQQPVSAVVDASNFQFYTTGIFSNCGTHPNQPVLVVGYVANAYWLVKNSWGTSWGEDGYIKLKWGNTCGIADSAAYPNF
jgi:C1A family cysteine protease